VKLLVDVLHRLVDDGNTVIVIEHNLDVMAEADYVVDIGPEAGEDGGRVVAAGTPEDVARNAESRTAPFLRSALSPRKARKGRGAGRSLATTQRSQR
ncbi:MAG: ABC transporter, partial [Verrucomicrobia bacterium]|nr:ABC transporter [Verrucomicrobiota bacterium]